MIAIAMLLILGSAVSLGFGWVVANESLIYGSIAATSVAALLLAVAYYLSIRAARAPVDIESLVVEPEPEEDEPPAG